MKIYNVGWKYPKVEATKGEADKNKHTKMLQ
jgi:hypothetical protein